MGLRGREGSCVVPKLHPLAAGVTPNCEKEKPQGCWQPGSLHPRPQLPLKRQCCKGKLAWGCGRESHGFIVGFVFSCLCIYSLTSEHRTFQFPRLWRREGGRDWRCLEKSLRKEARQRDMARSPALGHS